MLIQGILMQNQSFQWVSNMSHLFNWKCEILEFILQNMYPKLLTCDCTQQMGSYKCNHLLAQNWSYYAQIKSQFLYSFYGMT